VGESRLAKRGECLNASEIGVLCDEAWGMHSNAPIFNDADSDQMASIPPSQVHRNVDLLIVEADRQGAYLIHSAS